MSRTVCIVGAGVAGVSAIKSCLEEGLQPVCFESRSELGGTWNYNKDEKTKSGRVYESLITNVSKEASCFSDFPYPKEFPPFFGHEKFQEYLLQYTRHFELEKYISYNTRVVHAERRNVDGQNKWLVTTQSVDAPDEQERRQAFDCLVVCTGINSKPKMPTVEGLDDQFEGTVIHSCDYDSPEIFKGKRVLVIGLGNSGADIVVDISRHADTAFLSTRSGAWIVPRTFQKGLPVDMTATTRIKSLLSSVMPSFIVNWAMRKLLDGKVNHDIIGVRSRYEPTDPNSSLLVNDEIPARIMSGKVIVKSDVEKFSENEVTFTDGTREEVDCVICASGYETQFPFISNDILPDERSELRLYEWMFPYEYENPETIAVVGVIPSAGGSAIPAFECQTRYIAQVMKGSSKLPSFNAMKRQSEMLRNQLPVEGNFVKFRTKPGFSYQDRIAELGGFYPRFWKIFFMNPALAFAIHTGPFLSYHYRLVGRHTWSGARERTFNAISNALLAIRGPVH